MKIGLVSLGCSKNQVDSENILGWFNANHHRIVTDLSKADMLIVNTCGFIEPAKQESIETILDLAKYKQNQCKHLVVTGCLVQRYKDELVESLPEVDAWIRIQDYPKLGTLLDPLLGHESKVVYGKQERLQTTLPHTAYLKIAEGCSNRCTYCAIPLIRGTMNSYPIEDLVREAKTLVNNGVKELVLIAQDTSRYGLDKGSSQLLELLARLHELEGLVWIRMLYLYPKVITKSILEGMKTLPKVLPYFDIPIQHADDDLLRKMNRIGTQADIRKTVNDIREVFPHAVIRTTIIVGFPGETEAQFQTLLSFIEDMRFDRLGGFTYSPEDDTVAFDYPDTISQDIKEERLHRVMAIQERISYESMQKMVGQRIDVMIESRHPKTLEYKGRCYTMAPDDVDGFVRFSSNQLYSMGDVVSVVIDQANSFELEGYDALDA